MVNQDDRNAVLQLTCFRCNPDCNNILLYTKILETVLTRLNRGSYAKNDLCLVFNKSVCDPVISRKTITHIVYHGRFEILNIHYRIHADEIYILNIIALFYY